MIRLTYVPLLASGALNAITSYLATCFVRCTKTRSPALSVGFMDCPAIG